MRAGAVGHSPLTLAGLVVAMSLIPAGVGHAHCPAPAPICPPTVIAGFATRAPTQTFVIASNTITFGHFMLNGQLHVINCLNIAAVGPLGHLIQLWGLNSSGGARTVQITDTETSDVIRIGIISPAPPQQPCLPAANSVSFSGVIVAS